MAGEGKVDVEILYCVPSGHLGLVAWMVNEFYAEGGTEVGLTLTPGTQGVLQVYVNGQSIYDKHGEHDELPTPVRVQQMRQVVREQLHRTSKEGSL
ncbi:MAG: Rdx family protein [Candidatus Tectimicrobiota bacterium]